MFYVSKLVKIKNVQVEIHKVGQPVFYHLTVNWFNTRCLSRVCKRNKFSQCVKYSRIPPQIGMYKKLMSWYVARCENRCTFFFSWIWRTLVAPTRTLSNAYLCKCTLFCFVILNMINHFYSVNVFTSPPSG